MGLCNYVEQVTWFILYWIGVWLWLLSEKKWNLSVKLAFPRSWTWQTLQLAVPFQYS